MTTLQERLTAVEVRTANHRRGWAEETMWARLREEFPESNEKRLQELADAVELIHQNYEPLDLAADEGADEDQEVDCLDLVL